MRDHPFADAPPPGSTKPPPWSWNLPLGLRLIVWTLALVACPVVVVAVAGCYRLAGGYGVAAYDGIFGAVFFASFVVAIAFACLSWLLVLPRSPEGLGVFLACLIAVVFTPILFVASVIACIGAFNIIPIE